MASDLTYFLTEVKTLAIPACVITPNICKNLTIGTLTTKNVTVNYNFATLMKNIAGTFLVEVSSSDSRLINQKFLYRLDFADPDIIVVPPLNPYFVITAKCMISLVY